MEGRGRKNSFVPQEGLKEFLLAIKAKGIKIGLVIIRIIMKGNCGNIFRF